MKTAIPNPVKSTPTRAGQSQPGSPYSGPLAQLASMVNQSSRVLAQLGLAREIQNSGLVQRQRALAAEINHNPAAQPQLPAEKTAQRKADMAPNRTGLPDQLKSGVESLSGLSLNDVKVHYNSGKPAQLNALAYAQGSDIHVAPGQEKHLPHEAWHIVQQKQGRVRPTMQMKSATAINDDPGLEHEADLMGAKAMQLQSPVSVSPAVQRKVNGKVEKELTEDEYPESVNHIHSQIGKGNSQTVTIDRPGAKQNRRDSLRGIPTQKGSDRDEWPMAMFQEGGTGAHIEYIDPSDNRGCGSTIGCNLRPFADGTPVEFKAIEKNKKQVVQL